VKVAWSGAPADTSLLRIGGFACSAWLIWAAYYTTLNGRAFDDLRGTLVALIVYLLFFLTAFETCLRELPKRYVVHMLGAVIGGFLALTYSTVALLNLGVRTDALALSLASGTMILHGHNPYGADLSWGFKLFPVPASEHTAFIGGGELTQINYPALAILLYLPAVAFHFDPLFVSIAGLIGAVLILVAIAPPSFRTLAPIPFLVGPDSIKFVLGSLQDVWYVLFMLPAAFAWTEAPFAAGIFLGLACSVKQQPWLAVPFFLVGFVAHRSNGENRWRRFASAAIGLTIGFGLPNAIFALSRPHAWFSAVIQPLTAPFSAMGVGTVSLASSAAFSLPQWTLHWLPLVVLAVFLGVALRYFESVRNALWLVPGIALFFAPRSLDNYFVYLLPVCLASWFGQLPEALAWKARLLESWRASRTWRALAA